MHKDSTSVAINHTHSEGKSHFQFGNHGNYEVEDISVDIMVRVYISADRYIAVDNELLSVYSMDKFHVILHVTYNQCIHQTQDSFEEGLCFFSRHRDASYQHRKSSASRRPCTLTDDLRKN